VAAALCWGTAGARAKSSLKEAQMRSIKLVPIAAATAMLLALSPAGASARQVQQRSGTGRPCHIKLEVPKGPIASGESATIFGAVTCATPEGAGGKLVTFLQQSAPKSAFTQVGTATTEPNGSFQLTPPVFTTNSVFYAVVEGAKSAHRMIRVSAPITLTPPTPVEGAQLYTFGGHRLRKHNRVTFAGEVSPLDAGGLVVLQRENSTANEEWRSIATGVVDNAGKFAIVHGFVIPGDANIRVVVHPRRVNAPSATSPVSYEISQAQNEALKIESNADPLLYGQSVTIKGIVAAAAANTPVTLLARDKFGHTTPVATTHTGNGGSYEFTQAPVHNTFYRVRTDKASSAVLFEGVKYALTVAPPPTAAQAGQPLAFSGTVLPALVGHVVYLERQNPSHIGWHVIDIGTVGSPANPTEAAPFSIVHAFYTAGPERLRIKIPGDPGNQGAAGAPFELNVAQAPASALHPEAPGNSRMPNEGQL
jgi:hypothetical protein